MNTMAHKRVKTTAKWALLGSAVALLTACQTGPAPYDQLDAMLWTQNSVEKALIFRQTYAAATAQLKPALQDAQWDALPQGTLPERDVQHLPPAIILDVDETVLTNTPLSARDVRANRSFNYDRWNVWVDERKARALPGAVAFLQAADQAGIAIYYVTNREHTQAQATLDNLIAQGAPKADVAHVLGANTPIGGCEKAGYDKTCRRAWVGQSHRVLMLIGDSFGDFIESDSGIEAQALAAKPYEAWLGTRWFVLPNPTYGDWYSAPYGGDDRLPDAVKRAAKHKALDVQED